MPKINKDFNAPKHNPKNLFKYTFIDSLKSREKSAVKKIKTTKTNHLVHYSHDFTLIISPF